MHVFLKKKTPRLINKYNNYKTYKENDTLIIPYTNICFRHFVPIVGTEISIRIKV